jgi:hypothetical protein
MLFTVCPTILQVTCAGSAVPEGGTSPSVIETTERNGNENETRRREDRKALLKIRLIAKPLVSR